MGLVPNSCEFATLQEADGLTPANRVEFPTAGAEITSPPPGKVGVYLNNFDAGLRLPLTNFQEELHRRKDFNFQMLTPSVVHKMVAFEMICRANDIVPVFFVFKFFFRFAATNDKYTFFDCRGGHNLVLDNKLLKEWQNRWLWVNRDLLGWEYHRANALCYGGAAAGLAGGNDTCTDGGGGLAVSDVGDGNSSPDGF
ncbi:unnamed protein product [Lactuca saligna]|uniref:Uncharacterized protein n=1 Tax=Lactuca saligna TaxID=75948 RepID=A0AA36A445_LACSI|nr:unnamed protein product [Lactuca saligna]